MIRFYLKTILLGIALAMDACAISMTNGLKYPKLSKRRILFSCLLFGLFQGGMPFIGYLAGHAVLDYIIEYIPWIGGGILLFLGIHMLLGGFKESTQASTFQIRTIFLQALATSIDALSVGFTIAAYPWTLALLCVSIIAGITFVLCVLGYCIGKHFGDRFGKKAECLGGIILILIGIEFVLQGV